MNTRSGIPSTDNHPNIMTGIVKRIGTVAIFFVLIAVILFWMWAWLYLGICLVSVLITAPIMLRTSRETMAERGEFTITEKSDKVASGLYALVMYFALPRVAGLDVRLGWTPALSVAWHVAGALVLAVGLGLGPWAMIANAYLSTAVRIQSDRGYTVCSSGPYRFVRHPGYVGLILQAAGVHIILGSLWALIPGITATVLMIIRTSLEDRMLQAELTGYQDYLSPLPPRSRHLLRGTWLLPNTGMKPTSPWVCSSQEGYAPPLGAQAIVITLEKNYRERAQGWRDTGVRASAWNKG